jgi:hypothetical protein
VAAIPASPLPADTDFMVNNELTKTGFVVEPISGRCGGTCLRSDLHIPDEGSIRPF